MTAISRSAGSAPTGSAPRGITWWAGIGRVFEYRLLDYRRTYRSSIFNSFVGPGAVPGRDGRWPRNLCE